jgi:DNA-binding PadR family transcriptional regulator
MSEAKRTPLSMEEATRRMGEPSWLMLGVICQKPGEAIPSIEVIRRVEKVYQISDYPVKKIDPSTVHYAMKRMLNDGVLNSEQVDKIEIPGPHGSKHWENRPLYAVTPLGSEMWQRRTALITALINPINS